MTKEAALHAFFSGFGIEAYCSAAVPQKAKLPYLTYDLSIGAWDSGEIPLMVNLWFRTLSEAEPNAKARELSEAVGEGGVFLPCDGGYIWLKRGSPFCQSLKDSTDDTIKRRYINIVAEYLTPN